MSKSNKCPFCKSSKKAISKPYPLIPNVIRRDLICLGCGYASHVNETITPDEYDLALTIYFDEIKAISREAMNGEKES